MTPKDQSSESNGAQGSTTADVPRAGPSAPFSFDPAVKKTVRVLIVDDEHTIRESCATVLRQEGYDVTVVGRGEEAAELLRRQPFEIVLLDLYMQGVPGLSLLETCLERSPDSLVIMMTGNPSVESSLEALRQGAWDYLPKPFSATQLNLLMGRATHAVLVARESRELRDELSRKHGYSQTVPVLGESPSFRRVMKLAARVAGTDASVFVTGESGTGKELVAQFIHEHSRRSSRSLVAVNCAALPENLLESEMFGHRKGAFTGAMQEKQGLLEEANGGTLFLDELAEMSASIQAKLLRAIQDGVVRRVGSSSTDAVVNVRFVAATNRDPREAMEAGDLRKDLYYRLRVVPIHLPPLRERSRDIPILARYFLSHYWTRHRDATEPAPWLGEDAVRELQSRPWYGNVRELQNVMEHAVVLLEPEQEVRPGDIPTLEDDGSGEGGEESLGTIARYLEDEYHSARERVVAEFEKSYLARLVRRTDGNMSEAARHAGVDRTTLYRLMQKHLMDKRELLQDRHNVGSSAGK